MIVVLGSGGLLGSHFCRRYPVDTIGFTHQELDVLDKEKLNRTLYETMPDVVLNCAGIVKQAPYDLKQLTDINTATPLYLADLCDRYGIRLIHVSTNCVFDGKRGQYLETDPACPKDPYGVSKANGEVHSAPHLTIRTSFVGWPDPPQRGLLAWLHSHVGQQVAGYKNVLWNGLTTTELADVIYGVAYTPHITGIRHIYGETISKYDLLYIAASVYEWDCRVVPTYVPEADMTLATLNNDCRLDYTPFRQQVEEMLDANC